MLSRRTTHDARRTAHGAQLRGFGSPLGEADSKAPLLGELVPRSFSEGLGWVLTRKLKFTLISKSELIQKSFEKM